MALKSSIDERDDQQLTRGAAPATVGYRHGNAVETASYRTAGGSDTIDYHSGGALARADRDARPALDDPGALHDRVLGDFVLGEVLGEGGCGTVYRAEQRTLGRPAVVKVIHRALTAQRDPAERFAREARLASRFDHPYAAHVYAFGVERDDLMWIAMELVDGTPLGRLVRQSGPLTVERFVPLFERLCEVVQSAHDQGIVHRDIKPSNVMVIARAGRLMPKLLDFGIAKLVGAGGDLAAASTEPWPAAAASAGDALADDGSHSLTHEGQVLGSPAYMAPEQWHDATTAGPLADQYALALLAYEALTGTHAFTGPTIDALARQHRDAPLPALPAHLPAALHAVLARACDKQPSRRFANLTELASATRIAALGVDARDLEEPTATLPDEVAPYPGLAAYTASDAASFVGRERDALDLIDRLRTQSIVTVVGPSGSGKTSFLAAGLVPALGSRWHAELIRPGGDPVAVLAAVAARLDAPPYREAAGGDPPSSPAAIAAALAGLAEARDAVIVVIVDQAEELFTMCSDPARRAAFAEALALASANPRIRTVLALRDDFLCRTEQIPAWRGVLGRAVHVLGIPHRDDLERMLTVPARRRGFGFDDPALPREIVDEVADRPGALPLVAFTAAQLWDHRDRRFRRLTRAAYQRIGGVAGALVQHADSVVDRMSGPDRRQVRLVFRRLLTAEGARALISRAELESSLEAGSGAAVIDRLLAARLIVSRDDDAGDRIEIIHETLATTWPRLAAWRRDDAAGARLQEQLAVAARHWDERERPTDLLWRGDALSDLRRWQTTGDRSTTPIEQAFARASIASAARARRIRIGLIASAFALLIAGVIGLLSANRKIADQRAVALDRLTASFEERGRLAIGDGDDPRAMLYLAEAARLGAHGPGFDLLTSHAAESLDAGLEVIGHSKAGIMVTEVSPAAIVTIGLDLTLSRWDRAGTQTHLADATLWATLVGELTIAVSRQGDVAAIDRTGHVVWRHDQAIAAATTRSGLAGSSAAHLAAAFSKTATLWDTETGRARGVLRPEHDVSAIAFDAAGARVATGDVAGAVQIWDTATAAVIATCEAHTGVVRDLRFAPDGRSLVSGGNDGDVRICDAASGATVHRLIGHSHQVLSVDIAADGRSIVSGGRDGKPRVWDARTGLLVRVLDGHHGTVTAARFSPDASLILTLGLDGTARLWNREGMALGSFQGHGGPIYAGGWEPDSRHLITTSFDGSIRRWDAGRAIRVAAQHAHTAAITDLAVSSDDRWVLTASADNHVRLWDRRAPSPRSEPVAELAHDGKVRAVVFGPGDASALTTDDAGNARVWRLPTGALATRLASKVTAATFARDGGIITAGDGKVRFWTPAGTELGAVPLDYPADQLILDPTGRWLFVRGKTSSVLVVDVAARAPLVHLAIRDHQVLAIAADAARVAVSDGTAIRLWQLGTWIPLGELTGHKSLVTGVWFLGDGRLISAAADATLAWTGDGRLSAKLADTNHVFALATSADGALFAATGSDGAIRIWDAATYRMLLLLPGHRLPAFALKLSHDGASVISGGNDGSLVTWDLAHRTRSTAELADIVRCRVPLRLDGDVALPRDLEFDDPTCRSLALDR
jgi:WD40 repeat protein/serine/threonine protein kinase